MVYETLINNKNYTANFNGKNSRKICINNHKKSRKSNILDVDKG